MLFGWQINSVTSPLFSFSFSWIVLTFWPWITITMKPKVMRAMSEFIVGLGRSGRRLKHQQMLVPSYLLYCSRYHNRSYTYLITIKIISRWPDTHCFLLIWCILLYTLTPRYFLVHNPIVRMPVSLGCNTPWHPAWALLPISFNFGSSFCYYWVR